MNALPREKSYTYEDLLSWDDGDRYELYDGIPVAMASPSDVHQDVLGEIYWQIKSYLRGKQCRVFFAPFDVRLFEKPGDKPGDVDTVVQPDLMVVCDPDKIDGHGIYGAPDLVVEITSPSTRRYDRLLKLDRYMRAGVREYWIVDPAERLVWVYTLEEDGFYHTATVYSAGSVQPTVPVGILEGCVIDLTTVFPEGRE